MKKKKFPTMGQINQWFRAIESDLRDLIDKNQVVAEDVEDMLELAREAREMTE